MQGLPPECYKPLPPNSLEDTFREEVENYLNIWSATTPLIEHLVGEIITVQEGPVLPVNLTLTNPLDPLLLRVDSSGNIIAEDYPRLSSRSFGQLDMEP
jgi:hypothetical protein